METKRNHPAASAKCCRVAVRLDAASKSALEAYCSQEKVSQAEAARRGVLLLRENLRKR